MNSLKNSLISTTLPFLLLMLMSNNIGASVGRVLFVRAPVSLEKPEVVKLNRRDTIDAGDVIVTGTRGYVQVKLDDGTKVIVRPNSRFVVEVRK